VAQALADLLAPIRILIVHRKVIGTFVRRDLRGRYVNSVLGLAWAVIQPLSLLVLYTFVFSVVLGIRLGRDTSTAGFAFYLFCGMLPWLAFAEGLSRSASVVIDHAHLIKKVVFPSEILPAYVVASALVSELIGLAVFVLAVSVFYEPPGWTLLALPLVMAGQVLLTLGLGWLLASLNVFLRDVGQGLGLGLTLWMLLTPIFYPADMVPARLRWALRWNPLYYVVEGYRDVLLDHRLPAPGHLVALGTIAVAAFVGGSWFFRRSKNAFIDVI
jgi:lipopolysaccharide transport system permease protein